MPSFCGSSVAFLFQGAEERELFPDLMLPSSHAGKPLIKAPEVVNMTCHAFKCT